MDVHRVYGESCCEIPLQAVRGKLHQDPTIGCPGLETTPHAVLALLAILFYLFKFDSPNTDCALFLRSLHFAG